MALFDYLERGSKTHNETAEEAADAPAQPAGFGDTHPSISDAPITGGALAADDAPTTGDTPAPEATQSETAPEADTEIASAAETDAAPETDPEETPASETETAPAPVAPSEPAATDEAASDTQQAQQTKKEKKAQKKAAKQAKKAQQAKQAKQDKQVNQGKHAASAYNPPTITDAEQTLAISHKKTHPVLKGIGITACSIVILAAIVYGAGVLVFSNRMLPNTTIVEQDISLNSNDQVVQLLETITDNYTIEAKCGSFSFKATQADLALDMNIADVISNIHQRFNPLKWPLYLLEPTRDVSDALNIQFDPTRYTDQFVAAIEEFNTTETPPVDATITYDEAAKKFLVQNDVAGTQLDPTRSLATFAEGIYHLQPIVRLNEDDLIQPTVRASDERLVESVRLANGLISARITLTVDANPVRELTSDELSSSIAINENFEVAFNEEPLVNLCNTIAESFNTVGCERTYTRADGKAVTVSGGDEGWEVNTDELNGALLEAIKHAETTSIEVPFLQRGAIFAERGQRDWPNRYIDVDLSEQHVRFYDENGALFWETDCITGRPDGIHNTPQGVWSINTTKSPSKLVGYEYGRKIYETSVTFWMPFVDNSIGFHDATWQPRFGGSMYANGYGSHGCVNLSYDAARDLFNMVQVGDVVVTHF